MAVYKRRYNTYSGSLTPEWSRFYVLARYAFADLFKSRIFVMLFIFALVPVLGFAAYIFLANNKTVQLMFEMRVGQAITVGNDYFLTLLITQSWLAFLLNCWVGPTLVSGDLTNGALPLFLSRPFSRAEYVIGKLSVLGILLSCITWVPAFLLFGLQAGLASNWLWSNLWMLLPIFLCSAIWVLTLALMSLAISAWVKLRIVATGIAFIILFVPAGIGEVYNAIMHTYWGRLLNFWELFRHIVTHALRAESPGMAQFDDIPLPIAWLTLLALCGFSLFLLNARLRAREVVRG